jgi:hypothetical protein
MIYLFLSTVCEALDEINERSDASDGSDGAFRSE